MPRKISNKIVIAEIKHRYIVARLFGDNVAATAASDTIEELMKARPTHHKGKTPAEIEEFFLNHHQTAANGTNPNVETIIYTYKKPVVRAFVRGEKVEVIALSTVDGVDMCELFDGTLIDRDLVYLDENTKL